MRGPLLDFASKQELDNALQLGKAVVVHLWARWCEPCQQLDRVLTVLSEEHEAIFGRVEAEEVTDISLEFEVAVVPLFLFFKDGKKVDRLEGADVDALRKKVQQHCPAKKQAASKAAPSSEQGALQANGAGGLAENTDAAVARVGNLVNSHPIMLLMKGTPDEPRCGFSSRVVSILKQLGATFSSFDILSDQSIRQAAKIYADWPSFPQLYVRGELVGGCDIVEEMHASGELKQLLGTSTSAAPKADSLDTRLRNLISSADVVLFMKGSPAIPQCGFSAKVVAALDRNNIPFNSVNILEDQEVREGLKRYSDWPTYPQLYAGGELLGGCDIVMEFEAQKTLKAEIDSQISRLHAKKAT